MDHFDDLEESWSAYAEIERLGDRPCSIAEADREYARNVGRERPHQDWILSDRDVWYPNPFFVGKRGPHPEYGPDEDEQQDLPPKVRVADVDSSRIDFSDEDLPF